jgi:hypothetical protein
MGFVITTTGFAISSLPRLSTLGELDTNSVRTRRRFEAMLALGDWSAAQVELATATDLMLASGAAMELTGSFTKREYQQDIRPSMTPPQVQSDNFSGLMSWEHAVLVQLWKRLTPVFAALPAELQPQHDRFIAAYLKLANSHKAVCQKFGGDEAGSLRFEKERAIDTLDKFRQLRCQFVDPQHQGKQYPFHPSP